MNERNVFINCPFDDEFFPLLKCLLFTTLYLDLEPLLAETTDSGEARLHKLVALMKQSRFSVHDLSRVKPVRPRGLPRCNMPFECGIDFGLRFSDGQSFHGKRFLILGAGRRDYQKFLSDIAGNDIRAHGNDAEQMIKAVRDWFRMFAGEVPRHREIWLAYNEFEYVYESNLSKDGYNPKSIEAMTFRDIIDTMKTWIANFRAANTTS